MAMERRVNPPTVRTACPNWVRSNPRLLRLWIIHDKKNENNKNEWVKRFQE